MNYYNPYFYQIPQNLISSGARTGLFSRLLGGRTFSFGGLLNGTERVLNFANQAIPLVKQVKPMIGNAKTMFKVMNEFKRSEVQTNTNAKQSIKSNTTNNVNESTINDNNNNNNIANEPTFFI